MRASSERATVRKLETAAEALLSCYQVAELQQKIKEECIARECSQVGLAKLAAALKLTEDSARLIKEAQGELGRRDCWTGRGGTEERMSPESSQEKLRGGEGQDETAERSFARSVRKNEQM